MDQYCKLPTNIKSLDELTNGGIILNGINVIAARCDNGKSILSTMIGVSLFKTGHKVLFIDIQDSGTIRLISIYHTLLNIELGANINSCDLSTLVSNFQTNGGSINIDSMAHRNINLNDLLKYISNVYNETKFDVLIIDGIESIIGYNKSDIIKLGEFNDNKNITTILPMQLNRNLMNITLSNGYIMYSDLVIIIKPILKKINIFEFNLIKNRIGKTNSLNVKYMPRKFIVKNLSLIDKIRLYISQLFIIIKNLSFIDNIRLKIYNIFK